MMVHAYINRITKQHDLAAAKELAIFQQNQVYAMKEVAQKENLDCDAVLTRCFETFLSQSHADEEKQIYDEELDAGLDFIRDVDYVGPKYAENLSGVKNAKGGVTTTGLQLWPYKFVTGLLARLIERSSINVQTHTLVTSISSSHDGHSIVKTPRGNILAKKVVFATNAYTAGISPSFSNKIIPIKGICSHTSVPKDTAHPPPHLNHTYGLSYNGYGVRDYLIPRPDGGVICGGGRETFVEDKKLWFNNWDDSTLLEPARQYFDNIMQDNFRGWEKSGATVDYLWTGIMGRTADGWPHCGKVPGQENHFILAGFNGAGMPAIFLTAKGIARMLREGIPFAETGIPRIFRTSAERLKEDVTV
ncbi:Uncharacterized protein BP5553_06949 [Venustampulla echinocandica]|uniref:FAD dependent oxidoreductase domain-containing protein n=1 Tax=Venustampulla echinocandica TaxID=2656787 RepID=A0A370TI31_9HELO|nr:Uncharacterized protein BP5553_06949 [Venustampulla echinocandica]RDL35018.1 Uncharacterized protein BP5553_06949 [Venustampulla echinocandica]